MQEPFLLDSIPKNRLFPYKASPTVGFVPSSNPSNTWLRFGTVPHRPSWTCTAADALGFSLSWTPISWVVRRRVRSTWGSSAAATCRAQSSPEPCDIPRYTWHTHMTRTYDTHIWYTHMMHTYDTHIWHTHMMHTYDSHIWFTYMMHTYDTHERTFFA